MINPLITAMAGLVRGGGGAGPNGSWDYVVGTESGGRPVSVATLLARCNYDPTASARFLMMVPPLTAQREFARTVARSTIDGEPCPDPAATARAALAYAGRAVAMADIHPERQVVALILTTLFRRRGQPRG